MPSSDIISNGKIYYLRFTLCIPSFVLEQKTTCEVFTHTSIYTFVCWISCEVIQVSPHNDTLGYTVSRPHEIPSAIPYSEAHGIGLEKAIIHFSNMHTYSTLLCTTEKIRQLWHMVQKQISFCFEHVLWYFAPEVLWKFRHTKSWSKMLMSGSRHSFTNHCFAEI